GDELYTRHLDAVGGEKRLVALLQAGIDVVDDREFGAKCAISLGAGRAEPVVDGTHVSGAQFEPVAGVDLDRIEEPAADELGAGDQRLRRPYIFLKQMQAIDRWLVIGAVQIAGEGVRLLKQP